MPSSALSKRVLLAVVALVVTIVVPTLGETAATAGTAKGMFKVRCMFSHSAPDDPIIYPGRPGAAHLHEFTGNTSTDANSTTASLQAAGTTCLNAQDKSPYWAPVLYQDGTRVQPKEMQVYYRASNRDAAAIKTFPLGLRMVAGDHLSTVPQSAGVAAWTCGGVPLVFSSTIPTCRPDQKLRNRIRFPECWDGVNVDSVDHRSHMAYLVKFDRCPPTHPVAVPRMDVEVHYGYIAGGASRVTLSSGSWTSEHGDFINVWDPATLQGFVTTCLNGAKICNTV